MKVVPSHTRRDLALPPLSPLGVGGSVEGSVVGAAWNLLHSCLCLAFQSFNWHDGLQYLRRRHPVHSESDTSVSSAPSEICGKGFTEVSGIERG